MSDAASDRLSNRAWIMVLAGAVVVTLSMGVRQSFGLFLTPMGMDLIPVYEGEKEEIALVCMLDVEDDQIRDLKLNCRYSAQNNGPCKVTTCRAKLKKMIQRELAVKQ